MSLYNIDKELQSMIEYGFTEKCVTEDGELDEEKIQQYLEALPVERDKKIEAYGCYIKNLMAEADAMYNEVKLLKKRIEQKDKRIEQLKTAVRQSMELFGEKKKEFARCAFSFIKSSLVEISLDAELPKEYMNVTVREDPDKTALKEAIKKGIKIDGVSIVERNNLQVK